MPEENSNMDEMLKAYAKKRREEAGAPSELHPATRRMLQGEVKRTLGKGGAAPAKARPKFSLWSVFTVGSAAVVAVLMVMPTMNRGKSKSQRAATEMAASSAYKAEEAYVEAKAVTRSVDGTSVAEPLAERELAAASKPATATATVSATNAFVVGNDALTRSDRSSDALAKFERRGSGAPPTEGVRARGGERDEWQKTVENQLSFVQQPIGQSQGKEASQVLTRFQFSQNGSNVRITDADGSVYDGTVLADVGQKTFKDAQTADAEMEKSKQNAAKGQTAQNAQLFATNIAFRVAGTNRQTRQVVSFTGNFLNNAAPGSPSISQQEQNKAVQNNALQNQAIFNSIQGTVNVGGTNEFELNAVQTGQ